MLRNLLFFSKYDGDKANEKLDEILKNQKNILDKIETMETKSLEIQKIMYEEIKKIRSEISKNKKSQDEVLQKCSFLLKKQEKDNENIYGIINQLLLKDLLATHEDVINEILYEKNKNQERDNEEEKEIVMNNDFFKSNLFRIFGGYNND